MVNKCISGRPQTKMTREKISKALRGRSYPAKDIVEWKRKISETAKRKYESKSFDELGMENRRRRVFEEQNHCCNGCGLGYWRNVKITLELEHKDGNNENNSRDNLEGLCPNCHSLTDTWRGRNKPAYNGQNKISDKRLTEILLESKNIRQGLLKAGLAAKGGNYERAKKLLNRM